MNRNLENPPDVRPRTIFGAGGRRAGALILAVAIGLGAAGCGANKDEKAKTQRKEAALLIAEADFAITMRDWKRAEGLLTTATALAPGDAAHWTSLGSLRVKLGNKSGAKQAYLGALKAYEEAAAADKTKANAEPWLKQVYVLALLGRVNDGRALLDKIGRQFPGDRKVRAFIDGKQLDRLLADPVFKQAAL